MFEAALQSNAVTGKERELRRTMRETFQSGEAVYRRDFADRVHLFMDV